jgi:microcystin-dependent protein
MSNYTYTTRYKLVYPLGSASTNVPDDIENPLDTLDSLITPTYVGSTAGRPVAGVYTAPSASGTTGRRYYATDTGKISFDTGTAWLAEGPINTVRTRISYSVPGATALAGSSGFAADAAHRHARESWGIVGDYKPSGTASAGTITRVARSNHVHPGLSVGVPIPWPGATIPAGYLAFAGQVLVRATYPVLFGYYGTTWNTGGETSLQFRMPNFVNRALVGAGTLFTVGHYYGASTVTLTATQIPHHRHSLNLGHRHSISDTGHQHISAATGNETHPAFYSISSGGGFSFSTSGSGKYYTAPAAKVGVGHTGINVLTALTGTRYTGYIGTTHAVSIVQPGAGIQWITLAG